MLLQVYAWGFKISEQTVSAKRNKFMIEHRSSKKRNHWATQGYKCRDYRADHCLDLVVTFSLDGITLPTRLAIEERPLPASVKAERGRIGSVSYCLSEPSLSNLGLLALQQSSWVDAQYALTMIQDASGSICIFQEDHGNVGMLSDFSLGCPEGWQKVKAVVQCGCNFFNSSHAEAVHL